MEQTSQAIIYSPSSHDEEDEGLVYSQEAIDELIASLKEAEKSPFIAYDPVAFKARFLAIHRGEISL
jgi:hypothetical protein